MVYARTSNDPLERALFLDALQKELMYDMLEKTLGSSCSVFVPNPLEHLNEFMHVTDLIRKRFAELLLTYLWRSFKG